MQSTYSRVAVKDIPGTSDATMWLVAITTGSCLPEGQHVLELPSHDVEDSLARSKLV